MPFPFKIFLKPQKSVKIWINDLKALATHASTDMLSEQMFKALAHSHDKFLNIDNENYVGSEFMLYVR